MIKNIIFDMGGVLIGLAPQRCIEAFEVLKAYKTATYVRDFRTEDLFLDYEMGKIDEEEFCDEVRRIDGITCSNQSILSAWDTLLNNCSGTIMNALQSLKLQGYRLFLLSNTCSSHWKHASKSLTPPHGTSVYELFESCFLSFEMAKRKPSLDIFEDIMREKCLNPNETVFVDDSETNILAAQKLGLHTFHERNDHRWTEVLDGECLALADQSCGYSATIGFFDGVHRGHLYLINQLVDDARAHGLGSKIITFYEQPRSILQPDAPQQLLTIAHCRMQLLRNTGVDDIVPLHFTPTLSQQSAGEFMAFLKQQHNVSRLIVGHNHRFGHDNNQTFDDYKRLGEQLGMTVVQAEPYTLNDTKLSSSTIRAALLSGEFDLASTYLGRPYAFEGIVIKGRGEGRRLGFPTANLRISPQQLAPSHGVYAVKVGINNAKTTLVGMMNIGFRPTFGGFDETIEVHILDFDNDIYDQKLSVEVMKRLRSERKFETIDELIQQLCIDKVTIQSSNIL